MRAPRLALCLTLAACSDGRSQVAPAQVAPAQVTPVAVTPAAVDPVAVEPGSPQLAPIPAEPFEADLRAIAASYRTLLRVEDEARWSPFDCQMPQPASGHFSATPERSPHGQKLYTLYALDTQAYAGIRRALPLMPEEAEPFARFEQVIVKEAWKPERVPAELGAPDAVQRDVQRRGFGPSGLTPALRDGELWRGSEIDSLFIMYRVDAATPGTDRGWVYGVTQQDGVVLAAGRVENCMGCHTDAPGGDRLFGLAQ